MTAGRPETHRSRRDSDARTALSPSTAAPADRIPPDDLATVPRLAVVGEAGPLEDAVRGALLRQRVGNHERDLLVGERLGEHRLCGCGCETPAAPALGDLVSKLDDPVAGRALEATPADQLRR